MIRFRCNHCSSAVTADDDRAGMKFRCPRCGREGVIPKPSAGKEHRQAARAPQPPPSAPPEEIEPVQFIRKEPEDEGLDMTPMVDVTFLLLIFFMVTAAFSLQKSIQIPKPEQTDEPSTNVVEEPEESPDIVTVQIDEYNTFLVLTADWEKEAAGEIDLIARLREAREGTESGVTPTELLVKAHGKALHYRVVMALDAGSETGFEDVQLMTVDGDF